MHEAGHVLGLDHPSPGNNYYNWILASNEGMKGFFNTVGSSSK